MRTFVAIELDDAIRTAIVTAGERLRGTRLKATWVREHGVHLTLKFLGDVPAERVPEIAAALEEAAAGVEPFGFAVRGLGAFPNARRPRVLWTGVVEESGALAALVGRVEDGLSRLGFKKEGRRFHAHLTIGRVRSAPKDVTPWLQDPFEAGVQDVEEIVLFQSELHPGGAVYTPLARMPLGG